MSHGMVRCREIASADLEGVIDLLNQGFGQERDRQFWQTAVARLAEHRPPPGFPRFGHLLDQGGTLVGVILQIFAQPPGCATVRCSMSSWYVAPAFRMYASLMISRALRPAATYVNTTPAPHTWPVLEAQGYVRYCSGRMLAPLWMSRGSEKARVLRFAEDMTPDASLDAGDIQVLRDHAAYGCLSLVCEASGRRYPFVFQLRRRFGVAGRAGLIYCRPDAQVPRFAGALGRYLARRGFPLVGLDADGPILDVPGVYFDNRPKFFKGPDRPRLGDHAYSERAMFGA